MKWNHAVAAAALLLAGCSAPADPAAPEAAPETVVVTETAAKPAQQGQPAQPTQQGQPAQPAQQGQLAEKKPDAARGVPGAPLAFPGAGGPIPPGARPVKSIKTLQSTGDEYAVFKAPSGNIGCTMSVQHEPLFDCGVKSLMDSGKLGIGELGTPLWMAQVLHGRVREQTDPPLYYDEVWPEGSQPAEVVQYGEVVHHGPYVCAVEETGVTCWDSESGKGAWLEREEIVFF